MNFTIPLGWVNRFPLTLDEYLAELDQQISTDLWDIVRNDYREDIVSWNWRALITDAKDNRTYGNNPFETPYGATYLGSVFSIMPSGKYYTPYAHSNVSEIEAYQDELFMGELEQIAESYGGWIESGEGDPCDLFFCIALHDQDDSD